MQSDKGISIIAENLLAVGHRKLETPPPLILQLSMVTDKGWMLTERFSYAQQLMVPLELRR